MRICHRFAALGAACALAACVPSERPPVEVSIHVTPERPRDDEAWAVQVRGLRPGRLYTLGLEGIGETGAHRSSAELVADRWGTIDLRRDAPVSGDYQGRAAMGLVWSLRWQPRVPETYPDYTLLSELSLSVHDDDGQELARQLIRRQSCYEHVAASDLTEQGIHGDLFTPHAGEPLATLLVLGGSQGGRDSHLACQLAARGFETLALAYFREPGLPSELVEIPLEYFDRPIARLHESERKLGLVGTSKGAELALLLASQRSDFDAVVLYAPSAVVYEGIQETDFVGPKSSWTAAGSALAFVPLDYSLVDFEQTPYALRPAYEQPLRGLADDDPARIPAERVTAPLLLISGTDDQLWPSDVAVDQILARRRRAARFDDVNLRYDGAGHRIYVPYWPTIDPGGALVFGGSAPADARAASDSWPRVLAFLREQLE